MSLKKLISHSVIIGTLLFATPAGAASKQTNSLATAVNQSLHIHKHKHRWFEPLLALPQRSRVVCILHNESRSTMAHPNLGDTNPYQYGPFQFTTILWNRWSWVAKVGSKRSTWYLGTIDLNAVTIPAYKATLYQQATVFATVVKYDGFWPWANYDGC